MLNCRHPQPCPPSLLTTLLTLSLLSLPSPGFAQATLPLPPGSTLPTIKPLAPVNGQVIINPCKTPKLTKATPGDGSKIQKGEPITIEGSCFGTQAGTVHATWTKNDKTTLDIVSWADTKIVAKISPYTQGITPQNVAIRISRPDQVYGDTGIGYFFDATYLKVLLHGGKLKEKNWGGGVLATDEVATTGAPWVEGPCDVTACGMHKAHATLGALNGTIRDVFVSNKKPDGTEGKIVSCSLTLTNTGADFVFGVVNAKGDTPVIEVCSESTVQVKMELHGVGSWARYKLKVIDYEAE